MSLKPTIKLATGLVLAAFSLSSAYAATASLFAPPQAPAGVASKTPPSSASTASPGFTQDGSSFVFATPKVTSKGAPKGGPQKATAQTDRTARQKALLARVSADIAAMKKQKARDIQLVEPNAPKTTRVATPARLPGASPASSGSPRATNALQGPPAQHRPAVLPRKRAQPSVLIQHARPPARFRVPAIPKGAWRVSTRDYNIFSFPAPLRKAILPPDAPVAGKPIYLSDGRVLMLRFYSDGRIPVQLVAELQTGVVVTLTLVPDSRVGGEHIPVQAPVPASHSLHEYSADPNARFVPDLARLVAGPVVCPRHIHYWNSQRERQRDRRVPVCWGRALTGFSAIALPSERIYDRLRARPVSSMTNGSTIITAYILTTRHHDRSIVDPSQFSWAGARAVLLTGNVVDRYHSPVLYVVTHRSH